MACSSFRRAWIHFIAFRVMLPHLRFFDVGTAQLKLNPPLRADEFFNAHCENPILNLMSDECDGAYATCRNMSSLP